MNEGEGNSGLELNMDLRLLTPRSLLPAISCSFRNIFPGLLPTCPKSGVYLTDLRHNRIIFQGQIRRGKSVSCRSLANIGEYSFDNKCPCFSRILFIKKNIMPVQEKRVSMPGLFRRYRVHYPVLNKQYTSLLPTPHPGGTGDNSCSRSYCRIIQA
jgi:hypothetical protein